MNEKSYPIGYRINVALITHKSAMHPTLVPKGTFKLPDHANEETAKQNARDFARIFGENYDVALYRESLTPIIY